MENTQPVSKFQFLGYTITNSKLTFAPIPDGADHTLEIKISPKAKKDGDQKEYNLSLDVVINDDTKNLVIELTIVGHFKYYSDNIEQLNQFFSLNAPAILFPYIRAYVSSLTSLSGIPCVIIPTLNLSNLSEDIKQQLS